MLKLGPVFLLLTSCTLIDVIAINSQAQSRSTKDALKPYLSCSFDDGLKIIQRDRFPEESGRFREFKTNGEIKRVSILDGFRVIFSYPKTEPFVNLKAELSDPKEYEQDKAKIIEHWNSLIPRGKEVEGKELRKMEINGFEASYINRVSVIGVTIGTYILFSDKYKTVTSVYFLNAPPEKRKFQTIEEYQILRDRFLDKYTKCINDNYGY